MPSTLLRLITCLSLCVALGACTGDKTKINNQSNNAPDTGSLDAQEDVSEDETSNNSDPPDLAPDIDDAPDADTPDIPDIPDIPDPPDMEEPCEPMCDLGLVRCEDSATSTCIEDDSGCLVWTPPEACAEPDCADIEACVEPICGDGTLQHGEACDDGTQDPPYTCTPDEVILPLEDNYSSVAVFDQQGQGLLLRWINDEGFKLQGQSLNANGQLQGNPFLIATPGQRFGGAPTLSATALGPQNFAITWSVLEEAPTNTFVRHYNAQTQTLSDVWSPTAPQGMLADLSTITPTQEGQFITFWREVAQEDERQNTWNLKGQRFDATGNPTGDNFLVAQPALGFGGSFKAATDLRDGTTMIVWSQVRMRQAPRDQRELRGLLLNTNNEAIGDSFLLHDAVYRSIEPQFSLLAPSNNQNQWRVAWDDDVNDFDKDIYLRSFNTQGVPTTEPAKRGVIPSTPTLLEQGDGRFALAWIDEGEERSRIFIQRFDAQGTPQCDPAQISSELPFEDSQNALSLARLDAQNFAAFWVYFQGDTLHQRSLSWACDDNQTPSRDGCFQCEVGDVQVNLREAYNQYNGRLAFEDTGQGVILWSEDTHQDRAQTRLVKRTGQGDLRTWPRETPLRSNPEPREYMEAVESLGNGVFLVSWYGCNEDGNCNAKVSLFAGDDLQRETPLLERTEGHTTLVGFERDQYTRIATNNQGQGVVIYPGFDGGTDLYEQLFARRLDTQGWVGDPILIRGSEDDDDAYDRPNVAINQQGDVLVTWSEATAGGPIRFDTEQQAKVVILRSDDSLSPVTDLWQPTTPDSGMLRPQVAFNDAGLAIIGRPCRTWCATTFDTDTMTAGEEQVLPAIPSLNEDRYLETFKLIKAQGGDQHFALVSTLQDGSDFRNITGQIVLQRIDPNNINAASPSVLSVEEGFRIGSFDVAAAPNQSGLYSVWTILAGEDSFDCSATGISGQHMDWEEGPTGWRP